MSDIHIRILYGWHKPFDINLVNWVPKCTAGSGQTAVRTLAILVMYAGIFVPAKGTTLLQLGLGEMAQKSTAIARVRVTGSSEVLRGADVFTVYRLATLETLKAPATGNLNEVAVPGGAAGGIRQVVAGAPRLRVGGEYVLFLWTSRSGLTQIIGLSQGLFSLNNDDVATRAAADEQMLDAAGRPVRPETLAMPWAGLKARVYQALQAPTAAGRSK